MEKSLKVVAVSTVKKKKKTKHGSILHLPLLMSIGCMEDGTPLGDVELPPWANGDPQEFIRVHREVIDP